MQVGKENSTTLQAFPAGTHRDRTDEQGGVCILCQGPLDQPVANVFDARFGIDGKYEVWRCGRCQLEQMFPVPAPAWLKRLYESHYNFGGEKETLYTNLREWFCSSFLYRLWIRLDGDLSFHGHKGTGRLIDIGCNEGRGLKIYARNGFQVEGCELSETAAAVARARGFTVHTRPIGDLPFSAPYDVAVLSNVLEHVPDPRQMLLDVHRILSPNGQLWISCPNNQSWLRKMFGRHWINWHVPFHISQFSPQTLRRLLEKTGFTGIEIRQVTPALWVAMSLIAWMFAKEGQPTRELRNPVIVVALLFLVRFTTFPFLWYQNVQGHGDCLLVTASKA
jgi:SAM-dependent methyltransferase